MNNTLNELKQSMDEKIEDARSAWVEAEKKTNQVTEDLRKITMADIVSMAKKQLQVNFEKNI